MCVFGEDSGIFPFFYPNGVIFHFGILNSGARQTDFSEWNGNY
jgi:hypothetical protein